MLENRKERTLTKFDEAKTTNETGQASTYANLAQVTTKNENLIKTTIKEFADVLNVSRDVIERATRKLYPNLMINGKTTYFNKEQIINLRDYIINNPNIASRTTSAVSAEVEIVGEKEIKLKETIKAMDEQELLQNALGSFNELLFRANKKIIDLSNEIKERKDLEIEKYKSKELRAKINKKIRDIAKINFKSEFKDAWNYFYKKYGDSHCFKGEQNLDAIQERGHLKEFYGLLLNY